MERIRIQTEEFEVVYIIVNRRNLVVIEFQEAIDLSGKDLSVIDVLTSGGCLCTTMEGYTTIYRMDGNIITLSNDGSVYTEPDPEPTIEPYVPSKEEIARQEMLLEIETLKRNLEATDYKVIKCSEYQLLGIEMPYDVTELHEERQLLRDKINTLEEALT